MCVSFGPLPFVAKFIVMFAQTPTRRMNLSARARAKRQSLAKIRTFLYRFLYYRNFCIHKYLRCICVRPFGSSAVFTIVIAIVISFDIENSSVRANAKR